MTCIKNYLEGLFRAVLVPYSQSEAMGLRRRESGGSSLSIELSLDMEAVAISPSASAGIALLKIRPGLDTGT